MKNLTFLLPIIIGLMFIGCKNSEPAVDGNDSTGTSSTGSTTPPDQAAEDTAGPLEGDPGQNSDRPVITLKRTACFGTCPSYEMMIHEDGRATYEGRAHVDMIGKYEAQADPGTIDEIKAEAERLGFFEMQAEYDRPVTDLPSTIIGIRRGDAIKEVKGRVEQPESFKELAKFIEDRIATMDWKPVEPQH